jgi:hypothetical protein
MWKRYASVGLLLPALLAGACERLNPPKDTSVNPNDLLKWSESRKLTWDDFQGQPVPGGGASSLSIERGSGLSKHGVLPSKTQVICAVNKKLSWADKSRVTAEQLLYWQTEFDLAELYARKLRKKCDEVDFGVVDPGGVWESHVRANHTEADAAMRQFQTETEHGKNLTVLNEWSARVRQQIKELDAFKGE